MRTIAILIAYAAISASTVPALAAECGSNKEFCARWTAVQGPQGDDASNEKTCRAYAASFYESVMLRQVAARRVDGAPVLAALDSVINAFNDLLATKCGG